MSGERQRSCGEQKGLRGVFLQIECGRGKGRYVKLKSLKEGDEKNRREIEETLNCRRNHFFK